MVYGDFPPNTDHFTLAENKRLKAELAAERERAGKYQRIAAQLSDRLNGTPCAEIRWQQERDELRAELATMKHKADDRLGCMLEATKRASKAEAELAAAIKQRDEANEQVDCEREQHGKTSAELAAERERAEKNETECREAMEDRDAIAAFRDELRDELAAAQGNADDNYKKLMECRAELAAERERVRELTEEMQERRDEFAAYRIDVNDRITKLREALEEVTNALAESEEGPRIDRARAVLAETKGE
jgi:DNA repair exonuclease SbcCD ATPase subunit